MSETDQKILVWNCPGLIKIGQEVDGQIQAGEHGCRWKPTVEPGHHMETEGHYACAENSAGAWGDGHMSVRYPQDCRVYQQHYSQPALGLLLLNVKRVV